MNDDSSDLIEKISRWVGRSGFPLEMRVHKLVTPHLEVVQSAYQDPETGKYRAGADVVGCVGKVVNASSTGPDQFRTYMFAVIECKSGNKKPWVAFLNNYEASGINMVQQLTTSEAARGVVERITLPASRKTLEPALGTSSPFMAPPMMAYSILEYPENKNSAQSMKETQSVPYNAVRQVIDGAIGVVREFESFWSLPKHKNKFLSAATNFIVTGSRLFTCELDNHGRELIKETDSFVFIESRGQGQQQRYHYVRVMTEKCFESSIEMIVARLKVINDHLMQVLVNQDTGNSITPIQKG